MPARIGPYTLGELLAEGGMAAVYEATRDDAPGKFALKLPRVDATRPDLRRRILREVQALARLCHPHVVPVLEWGETTRDVDARIPAGLVWMVMPLVEHVDLLTYAKHASTRELFARLDELLDALGYAHDRGVVHRDVKPGNVLVGEGVRGAHAYLADFGVAGLAVRGRSDVDETIGGTPAYMPPEQMVGDDVDRTADLYAFGATVYAIFKGRHAFDRAYLDDVRAGRKKIAPPLLEPPSERPIPDGLQDLLARLLVHDPLDRFPSASAVRMALAAIASRADGASRARGGDAPEEEATIATILRTSRRSVPPAPAIDPSRRVASSSVDRTIAVAAVRIDPTSEVRTVVNSTLRRAGARVERRSITGRSRAEVVLAVLGAQASRGHEALQIADLAVSLARWADESGHAIAVGVAAGEATVGDGSIVGPAVDAAIELAKDAAPSEIRIASSLAETLGARHAIDDGGDGWSRLSIDPSRAKESEAPLGRARETSRIRTLAREVRERSRAAAVAIVGGAGMGKSAFLRWAVADLGPDFAVVSTNARATDAAEPLAPIKRAIREIGPPPESLAELFAEGGASIDRARAFDLLGAYADRLAARGPALLAIDDLQWADGGTRAFLPHLVDRLAERPFLVVVAAREPVPSMETIPLGPLDEEAAWSLVERVTATPRASLSAKARAAIARMLPLAAGEPYALTEIARLARDDDPRLLRATSLSGIFQARLDALDPDTRALLGDASLLGVSFVAAMVVEMIADREGRRRAREALRTLESLGILEEVADSTNGLAELRFSHDVLWEHVRARVSSDRVPPIHRFAAGWLERHVRPITGGSARRIAVHWANAGEPLRAAAWNARAGARAEAQGAITEAREAYERAIALVDEAGASRGAPYDASVDLETGEVLPVDLPGLLIALARTRSDAGALVEAEAAAIRASSLREPPRVLVHAEADLVRADVLKARGDHRAALEAIDRALVAVGPDGDRIMRALLLGRRGWILGYVLGRNDEGRACGQEALALLEGLEVPEIQAHIYSFLGANELRAGEWDAQLACNEKALSLSTLAGDPTGQVRAHINLGVCFANRGDLDRAASHAESAIAISARGGLLASRLVATNNLGMVRLDQGRLDEAQSLLEEAIALSDRHAIRDVLYETFPSLARLHLVRGDFEKARARAAEGLAVSEAEKNPVGVALAHRVRALVASREGNRAESRKAIEAAAKALGAEGDAYEVAVTALARALCLGEDARDAERALERLGANVALERARWG